MQLIINTFSIRRKLNRKLRYLLNTKKNIILLIYSIYVPIKQVKHFILFNN
jgi:hypothetical protein